MSRTPIRFYRHALSGHCQRVETLLSMLELPYEAIDVDLANGAHRRADYLALNAFGQVPVIDDEGTVVADSNAILVYLARRYGDASWLPDDALGEAKVQRWLSVAAGQIAFGVAAARLVTVFGAKLDAAGAIARGHASLAVMEQELSVRDFLAGDHATIADLACASYVAHAPEGNVSLADYPNVRAWLERVQALPRYLKMPSTRAGLLAA
jgi:glutathione S-transferase